LLHELLAERTPIIHVEPVQPRRLGFCDQIRQRGAAVGLFFAVAEAIEPVDRHFGEALLGLLDYVKPKTDDDHLSAPARAIDDRLQFGKYFRAALDLNEKPLAGGNGRQHFLESRNARPGPALAFPEPGVEQANFGERLLDDFRVYTGGALRVFVVNYHDLAVFCQENIHLDSVGVLLPAKLHRGQGVFRRVVGSAAIEETSNSILILQNRAVEILINLSILAFLVTALTVFAYATVLSFRVRKLRDNADQAIGSDGRVIGVVTPSGASDEVGDLSRSIAGMLNRLAEYNRYLETMASKLSHELRTPITVVRSSLENLETAELDDEHKAYTNRAKEGVDRLSNILTRMSEATRLEQTIQHEERQEFDLQEVLNSCIKGYQLANPRQEFSLQVTNKLDKPFVLNGVPDLIAQMLDKLVSNAMDFAEEGTPIVVRLIRSDTQAGIQVQNQGPALPEQMKDNLFDSMVSLREKRGAQPHLGLGLYIVRLIVEYHQGSVKADNTNDNSGVVFTITFPCP